MRNTVRALRRGLKYRMLRGVLGATRLLSPVHTEMHARVITRLASSVFPLRPIVKKNMELALGKENVSQQAVLDYFRYLGRWAAIAPQVYHHGVAATCAVNWVHLDDSVGYVLELAKRRRGMVLTVPHNFAHEVVLGVFELRHKLKPIGLARESKDPGSSLFTTAQHP